MRNYKKFWWWGLVVLAIVLAWWLGSLSAPRASAPADDASLNAIQNPPAVVANPWRTTRGSTDLVRGLNISNGQKIADGFVLKGEARGTWFFEGSFPWRLVAVGGKGGDGNNGAMPRCASQSGLPCGQDGAETELLLGNGIATAQAEWMTEKWVPFEAVLEFDARGATAGRLILQKDNPAGLAENEDSLEIEVGF